ncbi:hypothetical protein AA0Y32_06860 [Georgenia phoenicis]|uniref:hypothetical protein n=1 Tax=unclassified Georgenia TaxID=2626815 RepID=UPI0039AF5EDF
MGRHKALLVACAAALVGAAVWAGVTFDWAWLPPFGRWLDGFVKSSGFGALAALTAAVIAYRGVIQRIGVDRQMEVERRADAGESAERARHWQMLLWVYDNIDTADPDRMFLVCQALAKEVRTDLEKTMLAAIIEERLEDDAEVSR